MYPTVHIVTNNNSLLSYSIGHFDFNNSIYYHSTYKLCPAYLPAHSCQTLALNSEQTTLRAHYHTQLKTCTPLQWFPDALTTRSISIIDTRPCEPSTTTYKIINKSSYSQPIQTQIPLLLCVQRANLTVTPFMERLMHFRFMGEEGDNCEDYEDSGYDESTNDTITTSTPTATPTGTPIFNRHPFFSPPTNNPTLPLGFNEMEHFNMTHIITEKGITYYQYYLTGFPNFPIFGNFCIDSRHQH